MGAIVWLEALFTATKSPRSNKQQSKAQKALHKGINSVSKHNTNASFVDEIRLGSCRRVGYNLFGR